MDRKKRRGRSSASEAEWDEMALAKAAAWAWHQRGSLHDGRAPRPHEPRDAPRPPRPSRYQLEARAAAAAAPPPSGGKRSPPPPRDSISLFDLYEIECITRELERLIAASGGGGAAPKEPAADGRRGTRKAGGGGGGGRCLGRHAATICGAMVEALVATALVGQRRRSKDRVKNSLI